MDELTEPEVAVGMVDVVMDFVVVIGVVVVTAGIAGVVVEALTV